MKGEDSLVAIRKRFGFIVLEKIEPYAEFYRNSYYRSLIELFRGYVTPFTSVLPLYVYYERISFLSVEFLLAAKYKFLAFDVAFPNMCCCFFELLLLVNEELERRNVIVEYDKSCCLYANIISNKNLYSRPTDGFSMRDVCGVDESGNVLYSKDMIYSDELYVSVFGRMRSYFIEAVNEVQFLKKAYYAKSIADVMNNIDTEWNKIKNIVI